MLAGYWEDDDVTEHNDVTPTVTTSRVTRPTRPTRPTRRPHQSASTENTRFNEMLQRRLERIKAWIKIPTYNAFRYGMITLYVGTLLMVIGYHNPWMAFSRYLK